MPIKLDIPFAEKDLAKRAGAWWLAAEKTWVVPDHIDDLQPFRPWLPNAEGFLVQRPHFVALTKKHCWKCYEETPLLAPGALRFQALEFHAGQDLLWSRREEVVLFNEITFLEKPVATLLQAAYPFFKLSYSATVKKKYWANTCVHCQALQGDNFNFSGFNAPFAPATVADAQLIQIRPFQLLFDYYLVGGYARDHMYQHFMPALQVL